MSEKIQVADLLMAVANKPVLQEYLEILLKRLTQQKEDDLRKWRKYNGKDGGKDGGKGGGKGADRRHGTGRPGEAHTKTGASREAVRPNAKSRKN